MTSFLLTLALIGFVGLRLYRFRTKAVHGIANGWNLIFSSLLWGAVAYVPTYIYLKLMYPGLTLSLIAEPSSLQDKIILQHYGAPLLSVLIIAYIASTLWFQDLRRSLIRKMVNDEQGTSPSGLIPANLLNLSGQRILLSLKSGKVYVGILYEIDINEHILYENRALVIIPIKSGFRKPDKTVLYNTRYLDAEGKLEPKPITIKLTELESFTEFSMQIDKHFTASADEKKDPTEKAP